MPRLLSALTKPLLALALGLAACSSEQATTRVDSRPGLNLSRYKTYNFMDLLARNDSAFINTGSNIFDLKRAVTHEMEARGFRLAAQPDIWVNIGLVTEQRTQTRQANYLTDGAPYYIGQRNYHWQASDIPVGEYQEGTATIDLVDAARKELLWQGVTSTILSRKPSRASQQIDKGVADVFARLPMPAR
ncbi:DUF4136 domain-containing protein [Hymenobacter sp. UV11]|uniref:DUF4136 domain-containing protein n=1 Tax=Hymenobacter sp. UV11 TaxID=1849735 RepID=UPI00105BE06A|nr:DUF4136 domain-containing protein [Hymenobacter sp. UV11]TDN39753.1 hypothetical protein A8B98_17425 [Hymenobacter sp. UV11]TFZ67128.1 DUF4136 domain-containing protein [Hymenobacter sp. UV11]